MLLAIWPLFALIALVVAMSSPGPIFFVQKRVGRGGKTFGMIKFRSMVLDADDRLDEVVQETADGRVMIMETEIAPPRA